METARSRRHLPVARLLYRLPSSLTLSMWFSVVSKRGRQWVPGPSGLGRGRPQSHMVAFGPTDCRAPHSDPLSPSKNCSIPDETLPKISVFFFAASLPIVKHILPVPPAGELCHDVEKSGGSPLDRSWAQFRPRIFTPKTRPAGWKCVEGSRGPALRGAGGGPPNVGDQPLTPGGQQRRGRGLQQKTLFLGLRTRGRDKILFVFVPLDRHCKHHQFSTRLRHCERNPGNFQFPAPVPASSCRWTHSPFPSLSWSVRGGRRRVQRPAIHNPPSAA